MFLILRSALEGWENPNEAGAKTKSFLPRARERKNINITSEDDDDEEKEEAIFMCLFPLSPVESHNIAVTPIYFFSFSTLASFSRSTPTLCMGRRGRGRMR